MHDYQNSAMVNPSQSTANPTSTPFSALVLIGFMGAGKSSVGRQLAIKLGFDFIDLDDRVVSQEGRTIPDIFRESGEYAFRRMETRALQDVIGEIALGTRAVVALGGGAYAQPVNEALLSNAGMPVVFLDAKLDELRRRCESAAETRPLFQDEERFRTLYHDRRKQYMKAAFHIDTTGKQIEVVAQEILESLVERK